MSGDSYFNLSIPIQNISYDANMMERLGPNLDSRANDLTWFHDLRLDSDSPSNDSFPSLSKTSPHCCHRSSATNRWYLMQVRLLMLTHLLALSPLICPDHKLSGKSLEMEPRCLYHSIAWQPQTLITSEWWCLSSGLHTCNLLPKDALLYITRARICTIT